MSEELLFAHCQNKLQQTLHMTAGNDITWALSCVPLSLGALWGWFFLRSVGRPRVTKAPFATRGHVCDVLQAAVQWARSRGL